MKCATALFCLAVIATSAECASIGGRASLDRNAASFGGSIVFPRIPFINAPPRSIFPSRQPSTTARAVNNTPSRSALPTRRPSTDARPANNLNAIRDLFNIPSSLIPRRPSSSSSPSSRVPSLTGLSALPSQMPGVNAAIQSARNHVQAALNISTDLRSGIEQALAEAFNSSDPAAAVGTLAQTVLNAYITAAENCPLVIGATRILQEGFRLAGEIAQSAANVIFGTTSTTSTTTDATSTSTDATSTSTDASSTSTDASSTSADASSTSADGTSSAVDSTGGSTDSTSTAADSTGTSTDSTATSTEATSTTAAGYSTT